MTKLKFLLYCFISTLIFFGCITEYLVRGIDEISDILVVEGFITDNETIIRLSRSVNLADDTSSVNVHDAIVYLECDDGTQWRATNLYLGRYDIKTGQLNPERKYRLKIEIEEPDFDCISDNNGETPCSSKIYEYWSEFTHPIITAEIDSIFWIKRGAGQPVMIHVATGALNDESLYYLWSYKEDWEINANYFVAGYPFYCWNTANNTEILLGTSEKNVSGQLIEKIAEISSSNLKLSILYRIDVKQNAISKQAYDYFNNIKKNVEQMGSIFAPTPAELKGNIICITDPRKPVIGYVEVSTTTYKKEYISGEAVYEDDNLLDCTIYSESELQAMFPPAEGLPWNPPPYYIRIIEGSYPAFILQRCADCRFFGTLLKPNDWPNN